MTDRTDFEMRLTESLTSHAGDGDATGLAGAARERVRRRTRQRTTGLAVGAVLAVAAVPLTVNLADRDSDGPVTLADPPQDQTVAAPEGWRVESWRDVTLEVPDDWAYGGGTDWCADGDDGRPQVVRPEGAVRSIGCTPQTTYGVYFGDRNATDLADGKDGTVWQYRWESPDQEKAWPEDSWLGVKLLGGSVVWVNARERATAEAILESTRQVSREEPLGCPTRHFTGSWFPHPVSALGDVEGGLSLCRYGADGWLQQSERLTPAQSTEAIAALEAAPESGPLAADPCTNGEFFTVTVGGMAGEERITAAVQVGGCAPGVLGDPHRALTPDVLHWVLSPGWSGGLDGDVPVGELRR